MNITSCGTVALQVQLFTVRAISKWRRANAIVSSTGSKIPTIQVTTYNDLSFGVIFYTRNSSQ